MASEDHMIEGAAKATGDTILLAGRFEPKGFRAKQEAGLVAGSVAGNAVDGTMGSLIGEAGGLVAADLLSAKKDGTDEFVVAVSATNVYILAPASVRGVSQEDLELLHTFPRKSLSATIHARVGVRILILENLDTGELVKLEGSRASWSHSKDIVKLLAHEGPDDAGADTE